VSAALKLFHALTFEYRLSALLSGLQSMFDVQLKSIDWAASTGMYVFLVVSLVFDVCFLFRLWGDSSDGSWTNRIFIRA
jgi:hypothetical protein